MKDLLLHIVLYMYLNHGHNRTSTGSGNEVVFAKRVVDYVDLVQYIAFYILESRASRFLIIFQYM